METPDTAGRLYPALLALANVCVGAVFYLTGGLLSAVLLWSSGVLLLAAVSSLADRVVGFAGALR
jgi:hypothetical protein